MAGEVVRIAAPPRRRAPVPGGVPGGVRLAMAWLALILAIALLADVVRPFGITAMDLRARLQPPPADQVSPTALSRIFEISFI